RAAVLLERGLRRPRVPDVQHRLPRRVHDGDVQADGAGAGAGDVPALRQQARRKPLGEEDGPVTAGTVAGALGCRPGDGGEAWVRLSYALGLRRLGCEVSLVEEAHGLSPDAEEYARAVAAGFGLPFALADELADGGDLLVNISGNVRSPALHERFRRTA